MHPIFVQTHLPVLRRACQRRSYPCLHHASPWWKSDILECIHRLHDLRGHEQLAALERERHAHELFRADLEVPDRKERKTGTRIKDPQIAGDEALEEAIFRG